MRIATNEPRAVPAGRGGGAERAGFPAALDRAGDAGAGRAGEAALDALLAEVIAPGLPEDRAGLSASAPLLARAVERIALAVRAGATPSVTIALGRSLDVRIDQARAGVEVTIRAVHGLSLLAEAELPLLVAALRARGVRVARAGVLSRSRRDRRSLTGPRSSATTAGDDGSVAKW